MSEIAGAIIKAIPKWLVVATLVLFLSLVVASMFIGPIKIAGFEFGPVRNNAAKPVMFTVTGQVQKADGASPIDVMISTGYPPLYPPSTGQITGLVVYPGPDGRFPTVAFTHDDYAVEAVDLNDDRFVVKTPSAIVIRSPIVMKRLP